MYETIVKLNKVKFNKEHSSAIATILKERNKAWHRIGERGRFDDNLTDIVEILEAIGFEVEDQDKYLALVGCNHKSCCYQDLFHHVGLYFENCVIEYADTTNFSWKQIIKDGIVCVELEGDL